MLHCSALNANKISVMNVFPALFRFTPAKRAEGVSSVRSRCSHVWYSYTTVPGYHLRITLIWTGRPTFSAVPNFLNPQTNSPMLGVQLRT